jgi:hypothetical protein
MAMETSPDTAHSAADNSSDTKSSYRRLKMPVDLDEKDAWLRRVLATPSLSNATLRIAIYLAISLNRKTGCFFASRETIAEATGLCEKSITRSMAELEANDLLGVERGGGRLMVKGKLVGRANEYSPLLLDAEQPGQNDEQQGHSYVPVEPEQQGHSYVPVDVRQQGHFDEQQGHFDEQQGHLMSPLPESLLPEDSLPVDSPLRGEGADAPTRKRLTEPVHVTGKPKDKRGSRLSRDWTPDEKTLLWAKEEGYSGPQVQVCLANFRDYWPDVPGQKGLKLDWNGTFRNSLRRNPPQNGSQPAQVNGGSHPHHQPKPSTVDVATAAAKRFIERNRRP